MSYSDNPLISVIIPVYNVEKYLRRCIDSVLAQTYPNIEIILVNDGSTDNSQLICDEYKARYKTIKVFQKQNGGLSSTRNYGLKEAKGEFVGFIDSDDWIAPDMYSYLYSLIKDNEADASQGNLILSSSENMPIPKHHPEIKIIEGREGILEYYLYTGTSQSGAFSVCRCLFRSKIAKKFYFREGKVNEDIDWKYKVLSECNKFVVSDKICYFYYQAGNSISSGELKKRDFDLFEAAEELYKLTSMEKNEKIRFYGKVKKARTPFSLLCRIAYYGINEKAGDRKKIIKDLTAMHRKDVITLMKAPLPLSRKILSVMFAINFGMTRTLLSLLVKK